MNSNAKNANKLGIEKDKILEKIPGTNPAILQKREKSEKEIARSEQLSLVEAELKGLLTPVNRQWARSYLLMKKVRDEKLYKGRYDSFTQWVNSLADKLHYRVSNLWVRLQAGTEYEKFVETYAKPQQIKAPDVLAVADTVAAGTIISAAKIREKSPSRGNDAMLKAINGKLTKHQAELEWQHVRGDKKRKHAKKVKHNKTVTHRASTPRDTSNRTSYKITDDDLRALMDEIKPGDVSNVTAKDMCEAYRNSYLWCAPTGFHTRMRDVYMTVEELATDASTSARARRMDVCVLSNLDQGFSSTDRLTIHCIENKISKSDLVRDKKMAEYVPFCDYFWLSVTPELSRLAQAYAAPGWGIMTVDENGKIRVVRQAQRHDCPKRSVTYSQFLSKISFGEWNGNKSTKQMQEE